MISVLDLLNQMDLLQDEPESCIETSVMSGQ